MSLQSTEDKIRAEWGAVRAFFALHPWATHALAILAAWLFGHFRWPV
jgi:hypothetical protein